MKHMSQVKLTQGIIKELDFTPSQTFKVYQKGSKVTDSMQDEKHSLIYPVHWSCLFHFHAFYFLFQSKLLFMLLSSFVYRTPTSFKIFTTYAGSTAREQMWTALTTKHSASCMHLNSRMSARLKTNWKVWIIRTIDQSRLLVSWTLGRGCRNR